MKKPVISNAYLGSKAGLTVTADKVSASLFAEETGTIGERDSDNKETENNEDAE